MLSPEPENILPAGADTVLTITVLGFQYQARGLAQTLVLISQQKQQARTINARLRDFSNHAFRKYGSTITCSDINAPPLDGLFAGNIVTVECAASFGYKTGNLGSPWRTPVAGSEWTEGPMSFYRPTFEMMVLDLEETFEEWKAAYNWKLTLEEV